MVGTNAFVGPEVEGPDRGTPTMFIPCDSVPEDKIPKAIAAAQERGIKRFYFGAGEQRGFSQTDIKFMGKLIGKGNQILAEIEPRHLPEVRNLPLLISASVEMILVVEHPGAVLVEHLKLMDDKRIHWHKLQEDTFVTTELKDKLYDQDEALNL